MSGPGAHAGGETPRIHGRLAHLGDAGMVVPGGHGIRWRDRRRAAARVPPQPAVNRRVPNRIAALAGAGPSRVPADESLRDGDRRGAAGKRYPWNGKGATADGGVVGAGRDRWPKRLRQTRPGTAKW